MPVIHSVSSLASSEVTLPAIAHANKLQSRHNLENTNQDQHTPVQGKTLTNIVKETMVKIPKPKDFRNKSVMTRPFMMTKGMNHSTNLLEKPTQTDMPQNPTLIPIAIPCYMPVPLSMYQKLYPVLIPVPLPIPVPILVPTTRNSYKGIVKEIRKMRSKLPSNPLEAEMLDLAAESTNGAEDSDDSLPDTSKFFS